MTDDEFDDPSHDELRALLASAKVQDPIPDAVAVRLEATLAELAADRDDEQAAQVVVPLRRRLAPRLLVAAAVVLVVGAGGVTLNNLRGDNSVMSGSTAAPAAAGGTDSSPATQPESAPQAPVPGVAPPGAATGSKAGVHRDSTRLPQFLNVDFAREAAGFLVANRSALLDRGKNLDELSPPNPSPKSSAPSGSSVDTGDFTGLAMGYDYASGQVTKACPGPAHPTGTVFRIRLDGKPAVLLVHAPANGTRIVAAWSCSGSLLAVTAVPAG